jgi:hypothetical protein
MVQSLFTATSFSLSLSKYDFDLEETNDIAGLKVNVDIVEARTRGETRHSLHGAAEGVQEPCSNRGTDVANGDLKSSRAVLQLGVVRQGQVRLSHANRQVTESLLFFC